jgi:hypothetical protein
MLVGYARVSLPEQQLALQEDALRQAGCEKIYTDTVSGKHRERPRLTQAPGVAYRRYPDRVEARSSRPLVGASGERDC